jgi:hypothetical protein
MTEVVMEKYRRRVCIVERQAVAGGWRRELAEQVTVVVDGVVTGLVDADDVPEDRAVARVVVSMPDFVADTLAHLITGACDLTETVEGDDVVGDSDERALAAALFAASRVSGYRCPTEAGAGR